jgi:hypothetical protein
MLCCAGQQRKVLKHQGWACPTTPHGVSVPGVFLPDVQKHICLQLAGGYCTASLPRSVLQGVTQHSGAQRR